MIQIWTVIFSIYSERQWLRFACLVSNHGNEDHANACSGIQNHVNNLKKENSRNKDHESTVVAQVIRAPFQCSEGCEQNNLAVCLSAYLPVCLSMVVFLTVCLLRFSNHFIYFVGPFCLPLGISISALFLVSSHHSNWFDSLPVMIPWLRSLYAS